jgi:hypothetical protein
VNLTKEPISNNSEREGFVQTLKVLPLERTTIGSICAYSPLPKNALIIEKERTHIVLWNDEAI